jgi:DNA-binding CsgD family transcriptional regulator
MKVFLIFFIFITFPFFRVLAQRNTLLNLDSPKNYSLSGHIEMFPDTTNSLSLTEIKAIYRAGLFRKNKQDFNINPFQTYWARFELYNNYSADLMWQLHLNAQITHVWVYPFIETTNGDDAVPPGKSISINAYTCNKLLIGVPYHSKTIYYLKLVNQMRVPANVSNLYIAPSNIYKHYWMSYALYIGFVMGGLLILLMYSLNLVYTKRKKEYLFYGGYVFFMFLNLAMSTFIGEQFIFADNPWFCFKGHILLLIAFLCYFPFFRKMTIKAENSMIDKWFVLPFMYIMYINNTGLIILIFFNEALFKVLYDYSLMLYSVVTIILVCTLWKQKDKIARLILIGATIMVTGGFLTGFFKQVGFLEENPFFVIGVFIELIIFTYAINLRQKQEDLNHQEKELALIDSKYKLENSHRELTQKALHITQQEELLTKIKELLGEIKTENPETKATLTNALSKVDLYLRQDSWNDFENYFTKVHPEFYFNLKEKYPALTQNELRICAFIKLNLNTKEIANITHKSTKSIEVMRTRIRQKLNLSHDETLFDAISIF